MKIRIVSWDKTLWEFEANTEDTILNQILSNWTPLSYSCKTWACGICACEIVEWESLLHDNDWNFPVWWMFKTCKYYPNSSSLDDVLIIKPIF